MKGRYLIGMVSLALLCRQSDAFTARATCRCLCAPSGRLIVYSAVSQIRQGNFVSFVSPVDTTIGNFSLALQTATQHVETDCAIDAATTSARNGAPIPPGVLPPPGGKWCFQTDADLIAACTVVFGL